MRWCHVPQVFQQDDIKIESQDKFTPHIRDLYRFICKEQIRSLSHFMPEKYSMIVLGGEIWAMLPEA